MITLKDFRAGVNASIIELSVLAKELGIDVEIIRAKHYDALFEELSESIKKADSQQNNIRG